MSTILKALRRLEEDSSIDASTSTPSSSFSDSLPATNPHAKDELRNRILAEESAAETIGADMLDQATSNKRVRIIAAIAGATLVLAMIVGLVLGLDSPPIPDDEVEAVAVVSPVRPPLAPRSPTPTPTPFAVPAVPTAQAAAARSKDPSTAQTSIGLAPIPAIRSDNSRTNQASPANKTSLGPTRAMPSSVPERPRKRRLTPKSDTPVRPEAMALAAAVPTAADLGAESLASALGSSGERASRPTTNASAKTPSPRPTPTRAERQATKAPAAVSAAEPPTKPKMDSSIQSTRKTSAKTQPKPDTESVATPATGVVEEHKGRAIPDITVLRTAWHPSPDRRSAKIRLLDTKETLNLKEGDAVGSLVVQEISPSAVIFRSGEIELRLRVGQPGSGG